MNMYVCWGMAPADSAFDKFYLYKHYDYKFVC